MRPHHFAFALIGLSILLAGCSSPQAGSPDGQASLAPAPVTLNTPVIAPNLARVAHMVRASAEGGYAATFSTQMVQVNRQGQLHVHVYVKGLDSDLEHAIAQAGATDICTARLLGLFQYQAWATPAAVAKIAALPAVYKVAPLNSFPGCRNDQ